MYTNEPLDLNLLICRDAMPYTAFTTASTPETIQAML